MGSTVRVAIIGAGYMGSAHARVLSRIAAEHPDLAELAYIVDVDERRAAIAARRYGGRPLGSVEELPEGEVDLAVVATSTETHLEVSRQLVARGVKGLLVEKPVTRSLEEAAELVELEESYGLWVAAGHIERFNPAVAALHERVARGRFGRVLTFVARRVGPFAARVRSTDVVYDLAVHEVDNALAIYRELPRSVRSYTLGGLVSSLTDYALGILAYRYGFASIEVNRVTPFKQRVAYLTAERGVVFLDYMKRELRFYTDDEEVAIRVDDEEPLYLEDLAVLRRFTGGGDPPVDLRQAFTVLYICEKMLASTKRNAEVVLEEEEDYSTYSDILKEGLEKFKGYMDNVKAA
ncbi:MAG: Gfo/Idh/MocA family oxidoreductase [Thermoproteota archaeon]